MTLISIIEDDQLIAQMYRMKLESEGYIVDIAESGMTGIEMVNQKKPDLILLDYTLPDINGTAVLKEIRRNSQNTNIPVIVLTNMDSDAVLKELANFNIIDYIIKANLTPRQVVAKINQVLNKQKA